MRRDMGKIITEAPRYGSDLPNHKTGGTVRWDGPDGDYDKSSWEPGTSRKSKTMMKWGRKEFSDVLGPLSRWLEKQLGRPWDAIYSELCANLDKRKVTHKHVLDHVKSWVDLHVYLGTDGVYYPKDGGHVWRFFVNPETGLLSKQPKKEAPQKPKDVTKIKVSEWEHYEKIGGFWYLLTYRPATPDELALRPWDKIVLGSKRQVGGKDLRKLRELLSA